MSDKKPIGRILTPTPSDTKPFFVWNDRFALGVPALDEEHKRFFDLANQLHSSIVADEGSASAKKILVGVSDYARRHFDDEEARLVASACPYLSRHRVEHRLFVMTLTRLQGQEEPSAEDAFCLARDWILEHILGIDRQHSTWMLPPSITPP
jgi:hemerythrin-like metal-binding protein